MIHREVNPLNVFDLRRLDHCPPHFEKVIFNSHVPLSTIINWIYDNLEGRFYNGLYTSKSNTASIEVQTIVAFEIPSEATYFALCLSGIQSDKKSL
jgi:hypothetical protein